MFRIAKSIVKSFEQSVSETISQTTGPDGLDSYFQSIPPNVLVANNNTNATLHGLRVVQCDETQLQLHSYFDFIVGIDDAPLPTIANQHGYLFPDFNALFQLLNAQVGGSVKFNVWSGKGGTYRDEYIHVPAKDGLEDVSLDNSDSAATHPAFQSLGFKVQWSPLVAATYTYHVLQIMNGAGPAAIAGLVPQEDYIIGCQDGLLATGGETLLQDIIRSKANNDLVLYVYNVSGDCVRPVTVHIGGDGRLGCGVGYGFLHRIPAPASAYSSTIGVSVADTLPVAPPALDSGPSDPSQSFVPGASRLPTGGTPAPELVTTDTFIAPPPTHRRKKHSVANAAVGSTTSGGSSILDYFQEGKDQSPAVSNNGTPPPPPPPTKRN